MKPPTKTALFAAAKRWDAAAVAAILAAASERPAAGGGSGLIGSPGEFFWNGAYGTLWWADPKEQLVVVFMTHTPGDQRREYHRMVNALAYQAIVD